MRIVRTIDIRTSHTPLAPEKQAPFPLHLRPLQRKGALLKALIEAVPAEGRNPEFEKAGPDREVNSHRGSEARAEEQAPPSKSQKARQDEGEQQSDGQRGQKRGKEIAAESKEQSDDGHGQEGDREEQDGLGI